jgi:type II secretory pathway component GspD/PulD (secretin)
MPNVDRENSGDLPDEARLKNASPELPDPSQITLVSDTTTDETAIPADPPAEKKPDGSGDIVITMTPGGMVIASDDPIALSDFEQMMRTLSDQTALSAAEPTVFWLKYTKAPEAADLITKILGGDSGGSGGGGGGLAGSIMGELGGGMLGGLLGIGGDGGGAGASSSILTTTGSVSIVADGRLNALIVQANSVDMQTIEMILEVIDREESPEDVRTTSKPQLIPVIYQSAADVANIVKSVYAERSGEQGGGRGGQPQVSPQDLINALRGGGGGRGGRGGGNEQATKPAPVIIAVDTRSNSLIVTAPPQDVEDIRELVEAIDEGGMQSEETVEIVSLKGNVKAEVVQQALDSILGTKAKTTASAAATPSGTPAQAAGGDNPSTEDIQRRIDFFRQMRERGGFGGAPGGGAPGGGGPPTGFGGGTRGGAGGGDAGRTRGRGGR